MLRVLDGDTIRFEMAGKRVTVRVSGIDAPEIGRAKCDQERERGLRAKRWAEELMPVGVTVHVFPTGERDKFGRLIAKINIQGNDYATWMMELGYAVPYNGKGKRREWCQ